MNDKTLHALFEEALADEPVDLAPIHEDVARGRALRARRLRRQAGGVGAGVAALLAGMLVVPASPLSLTDDNAGHGHVATTTPDEAPISPEVAENPLNLAVWEAVRAQLPDDVRLVEDSYVYGGGYGDPGIDLSLERKDHPFKLSISLQNARPDLDEFRPCSDPHPALEVQPFTDACEEGETADGAWRVMAEEAGPPGRVTVLEGTSAAAMVSMRDMSYDVDDNGELVTSEDWGLPVADTDAIAQAALLAAEEFDASELVSGIDLVETLEDWPMMMVMLERKLGLGSLTPVAPADVPDGATHDPAIGTIAEIDEQWQTGSIAARYTTEDGVPVDVVVWQKDRIYDTFCHPRMITCDVLTGMGVGRADEAPDALLGPGTSGGLGDRSGLDIVVGTGELPNENDAESMDLSDRVSAAQVELSQMVPFLGPETYPIPDGI